MSNKGLASGMIIIGMILSSGIIFLGFSTEAATTTDANVTPEPPGITLFNGNWSNCTTIEVENTESITKNRTPVIANAMSLFGKQGTAADIRLRDNGCQVANATLLNYRLMDNGADEVNISFLVNIAGDEKFNYSILWNSTNTTNASTLEVFWNNGSDLKTGEFQSVIGDGTVTAVDSAIRLNTTMQSSVWFDKDDGSIAYYTVNNFTTGFTSRAEVRKLVATGSGNMWGVYNWHINDTSENANTMGGPAGFINGVNDYRVFIEFNNPICTNALGGATDDKARNFTARTDALVNPQVNGSYDNFTSSLVSCQSSGVSNRPYNKGAFIIAARASGDNTVAEFDNICVINEQEACNVYENAVVATQI